MFSSRTFIRVTGLITIFGGILSIGAGSLLGILFGGVDTSQPFSLDLFTVLGVGFFGAFSAMWGVESRHRESHRGLSKLISSMITAGALFYAIGCGALSSGVAGMWTFSFVFGYMTIVFGQGLLGIRVIRLRIWPVWVGCFLLLASIVFFLFSHKDSRVWFSVPFGVVWVILGYMIYKNPKEHNG